jgi:RND family efflux transporter MFP subunit
MNKYLIIIILLTISVSCKQENNNETDDVPLQEQKANIEKQIDSLNKILVEIDKKLSSGQEKLIPQIEAVPVKEQTFMHYIELQGNIDTDGNVMLIPEVMGSVKKIYKNEGDKVRKGEVIMLLDDTVLRNQISEVQTQYNLAKTTFERQKRLWKQKIGSEINYLQAKTKKQSLYKKLRTLRSQLAKFKVKAPIGGTLDDMMIKEGEMAAPQRPVARIVNLDKVYMQADVSEKYLSKIKKGTEVEIYFPELNKQIRSAISYVGNFIHPNNRTFKIRIDLLNIDGDLKPNLTGNLKIKDFETEKAIVLPLSLVQEDRQGNNYVFVLKPVEGNVYKVHKQTLKTGMSYKDKVMITEGLQAGTLIAGLSARGLTDGDEVKLSNPGVLQEKIEKPIEKSEPKLVYHTVKKGETLFGIHKKYKVSLDNLRKWNHLKGNNVHIGQRLIVGKNEK